MKIVCWFLCTSEHFGENRMHIPMNILVGFCKMLLQVPSNWPIRDSHETLTWGSKETQRRPTRSSHVAVIRCILINPVRLWFLFVLHEDSLVACRASAPFVETTSAVVRNGYRYCQLSCQFSRALQAFAKLPRLTKRDLVLDFLLFLKNILLLKF